jgi:hypothetical protein
MSLFERQGSDEAVPVIYLHSANVGTSTGTESDKRDAGSDVGGLMAVD